jgi:hypothetical protein
MTFQRTYAPWTQSYSGEDFDRTQRLAVELSPTGSIGYTSEAFDRAKGIVDLANERRAGFVGSVQY